MRKKILLIDDDQELCDEVSEILEDIDYFVDKVYVGWEGRRRAEEDNYDVILLDLKIPGDGFRILKNIKEKNPENKVIVVTANPIAKKEIYKVENNGNEKLQILKLADGIVNKPFDIENLIIKISEITL
jgi:DNA-binding response OmpR family regulator